MHIHQYMTVISQWLDDLSNQPNVHHTVSAVNQTLAICNQSLHKTSPGFICHVTGLDATNGFTGSKWTRIENRLRTFKEAGVLP